MFPTARFNLTGLIELGPHVNRYAGVLPDGSMQKYVYFIQSQQATRAVRTKFRTGFGK